MQCALIDYMGAVQGKWKQMASLTTLFSFLITQTPGSRASTSRSNGTNDLAESPSAQLGFNIQTASYEEAVQFAHSLVELARAEMNGGKSVHFHIYHIEGLEMPRNLATIFLILERAGLDVRGTLVTEANFTQMLGDRERDFTAGDETQARSFILQYEEDTGRQFSEPQRQSFLALSNPKTLIKRIKNFGKQLFGLPYGMTFVEHFAIPNESGQLQRRFPHDPAMVRQAVAITLGGMTLLSLALLSQGFSYTDIHFILPNLIVAAWVPPIVYFQREVSSFRVQGRSVLVDKGAAPGRQIVVTDNKVLFTSLVILQEWALNLLFIPAIFGKYAWDTVSNGALNAFLGGYGSIFSEHWKADLFMRAEKENQSGNVIRGEQLARRAKAINLYWFMVIYPFFKNIELLTGPMEVTGLPFVIIGTAFFLRETIFAGTGSLVERARNNGARMFRSAFGSRHRPPENCADILTMVAVPP